MWVRLGASRKLIRKQQFHPIKTLRHQRALTSMITYSFHSLVIVRRFDLMDVCYLQLDLETLNINKDENAVCLLLSLT